MAKRERKEKKKSGGFFGKFVCVLLGFILGVVGTIGGIAGLGYALVTQVTVKKAIDTVNGIAGTSIQYTDYITEEYADVTILGMIDKIGNVAEEFQKGTGSFDTLAKISPMVRTGVETLANTLGGYGVNVDVETLMVTPISELSTFLMDTVNGIELAELLEAATGNPATGIIALLCYGEEGVHYVTETNEDGETEVRMLGTNTSATIGKLTGEDGITALLSDLSFAALLQSTGGTNDDDTIMRTLLYGEKDKDYILVDPDNDPATDNEIVQPLNIAYVYDSALDIFADADEAVFAKDGDVWKNADGEIIAVDPVDATAYVLTDAESNLIYNLKKADADNTYYAYVDGVAQYRRGLLIGDLLGENSDLTEIIGKIRLGDLLDLNGSSDSIMLAVAYGEKGKDYTVNDANQIVPLTNPDSKAPTTIGDLIGGDGMALVENIPLSAVLNIESPLATNVETMLIMLAYGEEGVHYETYEENGATKWRWLTDENGVEYKERTIKQLIDSDESLFNDITLATLLDVKTTSDKIVIALAYGNEGTHYRIDGNEFTMLERKYSIIGGKAYDEVQDLIGNATYVEAIGTDEIYSVAVNADTTEYARGNAANGYTVYASLENAQNQVNALKYQKTKLLDLRGSNATKKVESIEIGTALGVHPLTATEETDQLLLTLAYGNKGQHYNVVGGEIVWENNPDTGLPYRPRTLRDMKNAEALIGDIYLETALNLNAQSPAILLSLAYGKGYTIDANDKVIPADGQRLRTIADLKGTNGSSIINEVELRSILSNVDTDDAVMMFMLYGQAGLHYQMSGSTVTPLQIQFAVYGNEAFDVYGNKVGTSAGANQATVNGVDYTLTIASGKTVTVNFGTESAPNEQTLTLYYAQTEGKAAYYEARTIGDWSNPNNTFLDDMMKALTLKDCLGESALKDSTILKKLADTPIAELGGMIDTLPIQDALDADIYEYAKFAKVGGKYVVSTAEDAVELPAIVTTVGGVTTYTAVYAVEIEDASGVHYKYYDYNVIDDETDDILMGSNPLKGSWRYLLVDHDETHVVGGVTYKLEREYSLSNMDDALQNMTENMQDASLDELHHDGIISFADDNEHSDFRNEDITYTLTLLGTEYKVTTHEYRRADGSNKEKIGEMTVRELLAYAGDMVAFLAQVKAIFG